MKGEVSAKRRRRDIRRIKGSPFSLLGGERQEGDHFRLLDSKRVKKGLLIYGETKGPIFEVERGRRKEKIPFRKRRKERENKKNAGAI